MCKRKFAKFIGFLLRLASLGQNPVHAFDRAIGENNQRSSRVCAEALDEPWLGAPTSGDAGRGVKHAGSVVKLVSLGISQRAFQRRALPSIFADVVRLERGQPECLPSLLVPGIRPLWPDVFVVLEVVAQSDMDRAHVRFADCFLGLENDSLVVWEYQGGEYPKDRDRDQ